MHILLIVENKHAQRWHDVHNYFYKNPLTGTTITNGQKGIKKRNLSFLAT